MLSGRRARGLTAPIASFLVLITTLASAACAGDANVTEETKISLVFHSAVGGKLEDCGCKNKPLGGLARRAALIAEIRGSDTSVLLLDGGNLLGAPNAQELAQGRFLANETGALGYDVIGLGPADLNFGVEFLQEMQTTNGLRYVSANARDASTGELLLPASAIVEREGVRFGITSVLSPSIALRDANGTVEGIEVADPVASLAPVLEHLRAEADVVVLLANLDSSGVRELLLALGEDAGVDIAIEGYSSRRYHRLNQIGSTYLLAANPSGKYLGQLDLVVRKGEIGDAQLQLHELSLDLPEQRDLAQRVEAFTSALETVASTH